MENKLPTSKITPIKVKGDGIYFPEYEVNAFNITEPQIEQGLDGISTMLFGYNVELVRLGTKDDYKIDELMVSGLRIYNTYYRYDGKTMQQVFDPIKKATEEIILVSCEYRMTVEYYRFTVSKKEEGKKD